MYLWVMQRISTKSRVYLNNKNKSHSTILFYCMFELERTQTVLPFKKIQKKDITGMILAGIYMLTVDMK